MSDKIIIKGLKVFAYHGVNEEEKKNGQDFIVDCDMYINSNKPFITDKVEDTISYSKASKLIIKAMTSCSCNLIERAADMVARELMETFDMLLRVDITLKKPNAPVKADFECMAVQISRKRDDFSE